MRLIPGLRDSQLAAAAVLALLCGMAIAQSESDEVSDAETDRATDAARETVVGQTVEEVVVIAPRPGSRRRLDSVYVDPLRARILKDLEDTRDDRIESAWRVELAEETDSRIKLGYDPRDEYRLRNEMNLTDLPSEINKPASLIRIGF
jgi:hypothetical protein